jgi:hypothetical protein
MNELLKQYFIRSQFNNWDECQEHFIKYLNHEEVLEVYFDFFGRDVLWQISMKDLQHEYHKYKLRCEWGMNKPSMS